MIQTSKRFLSVFLILLLAMTCVPVAAQAFAEIDQQKEVSLIIQCSHNNQPVSGVECELYYVAKVHGYGRYELSGDFAEYPVTLEDQDASGWKELAQTLLFYAQRDGLKPMDQGKTDESGSLTFPTGAGSMRPGLYLVRVEADAAVYQADPFMVCLPSIDPQTNQWQYDVTVQPKYTLEEDGDGDTITRKVLKIWKDDKEEIRPQEVTIQLLKNGAVHDTVVLNKDNNWRYTWENLPKADDAGKKITWGVTEKKVKDYTVAVKLQGITFTVTNTYAPGEETGETVRRIVQKSWDDKGYESKRPSQVEVKLMNNGKVHETKILNSANGWTYTWEELPRLDDDGKEITWTVQETAVSGYTANIVQKGETYVITNSVTKPNLPQTGVLWWPVPVLIAAGLLFLLLGNLLKEKRYEA